MEIKIDANVANIKKAIKKEGNELVKSAHRALSVTAQAGVNIIQERTSRSQSYKGSPFKKYSSDYAAFRTSKGRSLRPDLEFKGTMMGSITTRVKGNVAEIFFSRAEEAKKAASNDRIRPFFGFSRAEERKLGNIFFKALV